MTASTRKPKTRRSLLMSALFAEAAKHGISVEQLRNEIAPERLKKRLSKASEAEIENLLKELFGTSVHKPKPQSRFDRPLMSGYKERYEEFGIRDGMATPRQLRHIEATWMDISTKRTRRDKEQALQYILKRLVGVEHLRFVEDWHVQKILKAFESMKRRTNEKQG